MGVHPLDPIGANAIVAIADAAGKGGNIRRSQRAIDQQKIVAAGAGLEERDRMQTEIHSRSTRPREIALPSTVDAFNWRNNSF